MDVSPAHQEEDVAFPGGGRRRDDVSPAAGHVARRAVPLLAAVRLQVLQVERVPVVEQQRLARPRGHVHSRHCVKTISVRVWGARAVDANITPNNAEAKPSQSRHQHSAQIHLRPVGNLRPQQQKNL